MDAETWLTAEDCINYGLADSFADADADMSNASEVLQKANLSVEQRINLQKSLVAQLKQFSETSIGETNSDPVPVPQQKEPDPKEDPKNEPNSIMQMLGGFFINQKESGK